MNIVKVNEFVTWYQKNCEFYQQFTNTLYEKLMNSLLHNNRREEKKIDFYSVDSRCKEVSSFRDKLRSKNYHDDYPANKMEDLVGARIIGYSKNDVDNAVDLIKKRFIVHDIQDKQSLLGPTETGYQSIHIIASFFPDDIIHHQEFEKMKDIRFEIQVRTVFQEAWAALNHKKNYKFKGYLPEKIRRKLILFSAVCELLDDEIEDITQEVLELISGLNSDFKNIEQEHEEMAHYLYTVKIINDLNLENRPILGNPQYLQKEIFGTTYGIQQQYSTDKSILEKWIDDKFHAYDISLNQINFSDKVKPKLKEFVERHLKVVLKQGNDRSPQLIVNGFTTAIWKGMNTFHERIYPKDFRFILRRDEIIRLEPQSDFLLQVGVVDAYMYGQNGEKVQIHKGGSKLSCKDVPPSEYNLYIKTEYEPSEDGMANFVDRVKVI